MTSSEFRIRGAHLDADTAAVKKTKLSGRRGRRRRRRGSKGEEPKEKEGREEGREKGERRRVVGGGRRKREIKR